MVETCCVPLCHQRGYRDENGKVTFHKFPTEKALRRKWIQAIRRDPGKYFTIERTTKVCSRHFTSEDFMPNVASGRRYLKDNAVPSLFTFLKVSRPRATRIFQERNVQENIGQAHNVPSPGDTENTDYQCSTPMDEAPREEVSSLQDNNCCSCREELVEVQQKLNEATAELVELRKQNEEHKSCSAQLMQIRSEVEQKSSELAKQFHEQKSCTSMLAKTRMDLARAKEEAISLARLNKQQMKEYMAAIEDLKKQLSTANEQKWKFCIERFRADDSSIQFYTGLPNYGHFKELLKIATRQSESASPCTPKNVRGRRHKLSEENQLFLTLVKLRVGLFHMHLAHIFDVSLSTVSRIFTTWINKLYENLTDMPWWPERDVVDSTMPEEFKQKYPKTRVIIDATEIRCEASSSLVLQSETYSSYKSANTFKGLIGISPNGLVSFVSDLYTGSISDRELVIKSGLLRRNFEAGDTVMADKGFKIGDLLEKIGVGLNLPPFLTKEQFSIAELEETANIASLRIHVERRIQRIKTYHIFDRIVPLSLGPVISQVWSVCALLSNLQTTIVKDYEEANEQQI